ncbi:E3 ubiquitin-protein ligase ZNF598 isoform X3 [Manihot esculenta]|nr:E3 ubiquitin-protein ligase ZNF598 isoform X3 [Manihot esculenta]
MIKAMCRLSCNFCDRKDEHRSRRTKRTGDFNSIEQLMSHLFHQHRLFMCSLCLEGRKIFISEQKLYNRAQLNQHVKTGDSVVDGSESERGGFMGHPICEFCQNPFYGDNELYLHMSTEHFTCHICQRQHPGQFEYYKDYDDLEIHFRQGHFLCEDEGCLAKKFIVFAAESEMKRHDATEHGGRRSRAKRNAALQIPTSFWYRRSSEQENGNYSCSSDIQFSMVQDSLETFNAVRFNDSSLNAQTISSHRERSEIKSSVNPFELLASTDSEPSSRNCKALGQRPASILLEESSFPPLPNAPSCSVQRPKIATNGLSGNTMAAHLHHRNAVKVLNSSWASRAANHYPNYLSSSSYYSRPVLDSGLLSSSISQSSSIKLATTNEHVLSSWESSIQSKPSAPNNLVSSSNFASSSRFQSSTTKVCCSSSSQNLVNRETLDISFSDPHVKKVTSSSKLLLKEDAQCANKALVEKIRASLDFDKDKYAAFKVISVEYRQDLIDTGEYLAYVHQFGLSHLVRELAMLCPNAQKQRELVEIYMYNTRRNGSNENGHSKSKKSSKKGKEKCEDNGIYHPENALAETISRETMNLQLNHKPLLDEEKILSEAVCHSVKGKSKILVDEQGNLNSSTEPRNKNDARSVNGCPEKNVGARGGNKSYKKLPKFLKNRFGDISAAQLPDKGTPDAGPGGADEKTCWKKNPPETLPIRGVWQNGGGRRLVMMTQRDRKR